PRTATITSTAGAMSAYGTAPCVARVRQTRRCRRSGLTAAPAASAPAGTGSGSGAIRAGYQVPELRILVIVLLAEGAACATVCLPVRMLVSIVRRTFELSTFAQFFAVGTNQVTFADCASAEPGVPLTRRRSEVVFGRFPAFTIPASLPLEVKSAIHCSASVW